MAFRCTRDSHVSIKDKKLVQTNAMNIKKHSIFATAPPAVPGSQDILSGWTGKTYILGNSVYAKIENTLTEYNDNNLLRETLGTYSGIEVEVQLDDVRRQRIGAGLKVLQMRLEQEAGIHPGDNLIPQFISEYHMKLGSLFLEDVSYDITASSRLSLQKGQKWSLVHKRGNPEQQNAIVRSLTALHGVACIQGPPAIGKTTTIAYLLVNAVEMLDPRCGRIVCGAETNTAVYVMAARFREAYGAIHGDPAAVSKIVVDTEGKHAFTELTGQGVPPDVKPLTLRAHMQRMAKKDPAKWKSWLDGERVRKEHGQATETKLFKQHSAATREMISSSR